MKEKIRQFARESGLDIYGLGKDRAKWEDTMIKFAELIVRECMDIARNVGNISEPDDFALDRCYEIEQRIQDRFGVEE